MPNLNSINWVDIAVFLILALGLLIGYSQGLLRQVIGLGAFYLAMILATQYYVQLAYFISGILFIAPTRFISVTAFLIILIGVSAIINFLAADAYRLTKLKLFPILDQLGGAFLGLVTVILVIVLLLPIFQFMLSEPLPYIDSARDLIAQNLHNSRLAEFFLRYRSNLLDALSPWLPGGHIPLIFYQ